ncbi:hypothetical protein DV515_00017410, partial [Chloebia gouldiae]
MPSPHSGSRRVGSAPHGCSDRREKPGCPRHDSVHLKCRVCSVFLGDLLAQRRRCEVTEPNPLASPRLELDVVHTPGHAVTLVFLSVPQRRQGLAQQEMQRFEVEAVRRATACHGDGRGDTGEPRVRHSASAFAQVWAKRGFFWYSNLQSAGTAKAMACLQPRYWSSKESRAMSRGTTVVATVATVIASSARVRARRAKAGRSHRDQRGTLRDKGGHSEGTLGAHRGTW